MQRAIIRRKFTRKLRIRKTISGSPQRPRISLYKSNRYLYIQAINDLRGTTICALSNQQKDMQQFGRTVSDAKKLGQHFGMRLKEKDIARAVFDRNGNLYHGIVKAVAEGVRAAGVVI